MKSLFSVIGIAAYATLLPSAAFAQSSSDTANPAETFIDVYEDQRSYNFCTKEWMEFDYSVRTVVRREILDDGNIKFVAQNTVNGTGIGLETGYEYLMKQVNPTTQNYSTVNDQVKITIVSKFQIISKNFGPDLTGDFYYSYTVNANGELVELDSGPGEFDCRNE